jgi:hypothetical protein
MRPVTVIFALLVALLALHGGSARADTVYPWCAQLPMGDGVTNCGFDSEEQCRMTTSGNGGMCVRNLLYDQQHPEQPVQQSAPPPVPPPSTPTRHVRHKHKPN